MELEIATLWVQFAWAAASAVGNYLLDRDWETIDY